MVCCFLNATLRFWIFCVCDTTLAWLHLYTQWHRHQTWIRGAKPSKMSLSLPNVKHAGQESGSELCEFKKSLIISAVKILLLLSLLRQNGSTMLIKYRHTQHKVNKIYTYMKIQNMTPQMKIPVTATLIGRSVESVRHHSLCLVCLLLFQQLTSSSVGLSCVCIVLPQSFVLSKLTSWQSHRNRWSWPVNWGNDSDVRPWPGFGFSRCFDERCRFYSAVITWSILAQLAELFI